MKIKNCNNIYEGNIGIIENKLNIKYAINGTDKSTISKAITSASNSDELMKLKPFKYLNVNDNNPEISVSGIENIKEVKVFNEEYLNKYVFLPDELVQGSFDIFIRDDEYERGMKEINELTSAIQIMFTENKDVDELINDFNKLSASFGKPVKKGIHASSNISKALKDGNKIVNIPNEIEEYKDYIQMENNFKWIKWVIDGRIYMDMSDNCPYCISGIGNKKTKITEIYEPKVIEYLNNIVNVFSRFNKYFSDETKKIVTGFVSNIDGYTDDQVSYLLEVKEQIDRLNKKFNDSKTLSFRSLKDVDKVVEVLKNQRINIQLFSHLDSEAIKQKVEIVNNSIDKLLEKAGELQGKINIQKQHIEKIINENNEEINSFPKNAGINYHVAIIEYIKK